jgi:hypothetical protein
MKYFVVLLLVVPNFSWAFPSVGDKAVYKQTQTDSSGGQVLTVTSEIVSTAANIFIVRETTTDANGNVVDSHEEHDDASSLPSNDSMAYLLNNCQSAGGKLENMTVPAGQFKTCHVSSGGVTAWDGVVPFAMIRAQWNYAGTAVDKQLVSFANGN